ncbi:MAG: hypothetical protein U9O82_01830 [Thermodesulfobacteriota bacterium]|nr:hypothetical protein [Thermodesulfobacteriota bacterium]
MKLIPRRKKFYVLAGDTKISVLAELTRTSSLPAHRIIATAQGQLYEESTIKSLLSAKSMPKGDVAVALPLSSFETVNFPLPPMVESSVGKAVPYHLGKAISTPLNQHIYDWQITSRRKEELQITAYLFPVKSFDLIRENLKTGQLEIKYLEADVFAAFAYLSQDQRLTPKETSLCVLLWPEDISLAVFDKGSLTLVRTVATPKPDLTYGEVPEPEGETLEETPEEPEPETKSSLMADSEVDSILKGFDLYGGGIDKEPDNSLSANNGDDLSLSLERVEEVAAPPAPKPAIPAPRVSTWPDYIQNVGLEIMRTRDYYSSIIKGDPIKKVVVGGAEDFWEDFLEMTSKTVEIDIEPLARATLEKVCSSSLAAVCIGAGIR